MTAQEKYARVQRMLMDKDGLWGLSQDDKDALRYVLGLINSLSFEIAEKTGKPVPSVIERHTQRMEILGG